MQRLRGSDAYPIYVESSRSPFVTLKVAIYRPTAGNALPDPAALEDFVKAGIAGTVGKLATMRILRVPFDLHHPVWVADPDYSPDNHIFRTRLPHPGNRAQLCDFLSELMSRPLNTQRPLWEVWLVQGLAGGEIAIAFKLHHSLADGKTIAAMIEKIHAAGAGGEVLADSIEGEPIPGKPKLIRDALVDLSRSFTIELPKYVHHLRQVRQRSAQLQQGREETAGEVVAPFTAPYTILNAEGGSDRLCRYRTFSLAQFKALSKRFDCTVNSLVLGVCSEALRRYLLDLDALPSASLIAMMPIGAQRENTVKSLLNSDIHNNHLAVAAIPLYQNIDDFTQRVQAVKRSSRAAIDYALQTSETRFDSYPDFTPGIVFGLLKTVMLKRQAKRRNLLTNVSISNVPGPRKTLYALDRRLEMTELLSYGNLVDSMNLNITVWSYVDNLCFAFFIRRGALQQPELLIGHLAEVVDELDQVHNPPPASRH